MYDDPAQVTQSNCAVLAILFGASGLNEPAYLWLVSLSYHRIFLI